MEFNLADLYEIVADAVPDREVLVAGDQHRTFRELDERANRLAHHLAAHGLGAGDHVGVHAHNRVEWLEAMLAAFKIRAVPVNVNYRYVEEELLYLFDDADLVALIHERDFAPRISAVRGRLPELRHLLCIEDGSGTERGELDTHDYEAALGDASPKRDFGRRSGDDLYVLYTGGTTGMPKGVMWRHEDLFFGALGGGNYNGEPLRSAEALAESARSSPGATGLVCAPMMHGGGQWVSWGSLLAGNRSALYTGRHFDPDAIWRLAERERAASISIVGDAMGRPLADALGAPGASYDLSSLVLLGSGGAILSPAVKRELRAHLPDILIVDGFGASETGHQGSVLDAGQPDGAPRFSVNAQTAVLDDHGRPVEPGSDRIGRLARRGHIPLGYFKDPERTARTFPEVDGVRWVLPGDSARVEADGTIHILGRGNVCINSGGEKIFPEEVEAVLKSHPAVFDALVVGVPDPRFVECVAAVVQPRPGARPSLEALADHCRASLAGYKVPRRLTLVDEVVRTPVGKPDYRWARQRALG